MSEGIQTYEGNLSAPEGRFAIVVARFNHFIVDRLLEGALDAFRRTGTPDAQLAVIRVPGAWELPLAVQQAAKSGRFDAVVVLGAVIRGATPHFDYVANEATKGTAQAMLQANVPVAFGLLTTDTIEQAVERAGTKAGNKGFETAMSAIEMVGLSQMLSKG